MGAWSESSEHPDEGIGERVANEGEPHRVRGRGVEILADRRDQVVGGAIDYLAELAVTGPYRLVDTRLSDTHRVMLLVSRPEFPRLVVLEPVSPTYEDETTRWSELYPLSRSEPNARLIGAVDRAEPVSAVREVLEPQNIRFVEDGDQENPFLCPPHVAFTFLSDSTYNRVGYVDVDLDDLGAIPARVFTANNTPSFPAHVVGECEDEPNLEQIFSTASAYSLLITEYVERRHGDEGFFTRTNVAALTEAAGEAERYEHGHVFD